VLATGHSEHLADRGAQDMSPRTTIRARSASDGLCCFARKPRAGASSRSRHANPALALHHVHVMHTPRWRLGLGFGCTFVTSPSTLPSCLDHLPICSRGRATAPGFTETGAARLTTNTMFRAPPFSHWTVRARIAKERDFGMRRLNSMRIAGKSSRRRLTHTATTGDGSLWL